MQYPLLSIVIFGGKKFLPRGGRKKRASELAGAPAT